MKDIFNIEEHYQNYLQLMGLSEHRMHPEQKKQLKEAFYGAWGMLLLMLRNDASQLPEELSVAGYESMLNQVMNFANKLSRN